MRLAPTGRQTEVVEVGQPETCPNGHRLGPRTVIVGYLPCVSGWSGRGHRTFVWRECSAVVYVPEHDRAVLPPTG